MNSTRLCEATRSYDRGPFYSEKDEYGRIEVNDLQELPNQSKLIRAYINDLKKTYINSLITIVASSFVGVPALASLICFASTGISFMHPYLSIFFVIFAVGMLIIGLLSAITTKSYFEKAIIQLTSE